MLTKCRRRSINKKKNKKQTNKQTNKQNKTNVHYPKVFTTLNFYAPENEHPPYLDISLLQEAMLCLSHSSEVPGEFKKNLLNK